MRRRAGIDLRLVLPACAAWLAAGVLLAAPRSGWWCCAVAVAAIATVGVAGARRAARWTGLIVVAASAVALVSVATALAGAARHPAALDRLAGGHVVALEATVDTGARPAAGDSFGGGSRVSFRITADHVTVGRDRMSGRIPALVFAAERRREPRIGERLRLRGTAKTTPPAEDVSLLLYADDWEHVGPPPPWLSWADGLRERFRAASAVLPGDGGSLLPGLAIGDDSRVDAELDNAMKASSLSHLTAVSGSNCAVIVGGLLALGAAAGLPRRGRVIVALLGLAGFVVLVTPGASVLRAAVMASIVVAGTALGRPGRAVPALSLAVLVLLVHDPWLARDYGFALSVFATAALLVLAPPLARRLQRVLPRWLALGLSVPIAAQLACQPILVLLNPSLPLYGVVANVLAEPAAPVATVIGLIGCLLLPLSAPLAVPLLWASWAPAAWIAGIARTSTMLPGSALPWPPGVIGFGLATVLTGAVVLLIAQPVTRRGRTVRGVLGAASALVLLAAVALQAGPAIAARAAMPRDWVVGLCDVGQGDAIVLRAHDAYGLIDTGPEPKALAACLRELGIRRVALLVLTHYDLDHVGGLDAVAGRTQTALVGHPDDAGAQRRLAALTSHGVEVHVANRGDQGTLGTLRWQVLWPDDAHPGMTTSNEGGVTLQVDGGGIRMLFLADLDAKAQDALLSDGGIGPVDVVKVAHHGSADQSDRLYGVLHARLGLISSGLGNDYGHPTAKALRLLRAAGTQPARTDLEGTVLVTARGGTLGLWTRTRATDAALWTPAER
ncbi:MAG TPA: ComEC/Rec2 family competence protein [Gryllotalpicola sp.]